VTSDEPQIPVDAPAPVPMPVAAARVAVIIPCFNDGALVGQAVDSVRESEPVELVVVDDGSTDPATQTAFVELERRGVQVLHQANTGLSGARMAGLTATTAPYVFPLDADDLAEAGALAVMADRLDAEPHAAVCFGDYVEFGDADLVRVVPPVLDPFRIGYTNEYPVTSLFRREALEAAGGWRDLGSGYEDWNLWMTLAERGAAGVHAGPGVITYRRRMHGERMLAAARRDHPALYRAMRAGHPRLFADMAGHRRRSDLSPARKLLYPWVYGGRRRYGFERSVKAWLDARRLWTLRG
jgi:glycosyltransferase involved in cell wall biosynthesis